MSKYYGISSPQHEHANRYVLYYLRECIVLSCQTMYIYTYAFTGCSILSDMVDYRESMILLKNFSNESCMAWRRTHDGNVDLTLSDLVKIRSNLDHYCFFKWKLLFFITYSYSLSRELSKTL